MSEDVVISQLFALYLFNPPFHPRSKAGSHSGLVKSVLTWGGNTPNLTDVKQGGTPPKSGCGKGLNLSAAKGSKFILSLSWQGTAYMSVCFL